MIVLLNDSIIFMKGDMTKEELRKKFDDFYNVSFSENRNQELVYPQPSTLFDWFYSEIKAREKEVRFVKNELLDALDLKKGNGPTALSMQREEIQRLEDIIKVGDKIIGESAPIWRSDSDRWEEYYKLIDAYNKLKYNH